MPHIADRVGELTVYQRSPPFVPDKNIRPYSENMKVWLKKPMKISQKIIKQAKMARLRAWTVEDLLPKGFFGGRNRNRKKKLKNNHRQKKQLKRVLSILSGGVQV